MVKILKANGHITNFDKRKIKRTVLRAGGSKKLAEDISNKVARQVVKGTSTREILRWTLRLLKKQPAVAMRYDLKRAIMELGPHGFTFEEYFSRLLRHYGYDTKVGLILTGKAITHEVDILAVKKKKYMIEAKYHNKLGIHTDSKVTLYTYARLLDLNNNPKNKIDKGWLVTNTRCTPHAIKYANGVGLKITSWQYATKGGKNLQKLIQTKKLYPITILHSVHGEVKERLARAKIVLVKDIVNLGYDKLRDKTGLREKDLRRILDEAGHVHAG
tara:strand:- start:6922 stop:7740 length:819 start_codon:yes stop_codon:yes gene_type:complete